MDDFGSGFSSLSLLKDLDVDLVKFDLRFLVGSAHINRGNFIIGALIAMVKQLGMKTLVEGVETERSWSISKAWAVNGCRDISTAGPSRLPNC